MSIIKPYGIRAKQRSFEQSYYGGYCVKARENGLEPMPYVIFQDKLSKVLNLSSTKKDRMKMLIELTHLYRNRKEDVIEQVVTKI